MKKLFILFMVLNLLQRGFSQTNIFPSSGNVGIGTASPKYNLDVNGTTNISGSLDAGLISSHSADFVLGLNDGRTNANGNNPPSMRALSHTNWRTTEKNELIVNVGDYTGGVIVQGKGFFVDGNIGIATVNPRSKLDVWGGDFMITGNDFNGTAYITSRAGTAYYGNNSYSNGIAVLPSGSIGIGTTNPGSFKLAVEGNIGARKVIVTKTSPFPDYVFNEEYNLPSLLQIEQFIRANKHLPEIPTAKEVEKDGIDLGNNQTLLLKKIEEITLYLIEQNKRSERLEKENEEMKRQIFQQQSEIEKLKVKK